ncbi:MAG: hypothetical protein FWD73_00130 [Polyangiaceae bacterium]|nr:hypothetical protein [Polyangiaceae bacterium]
MKTWLRPLPFALALAYALARVGRTPIDRAAPSEEAALCTALGQQGVTCAAGDVLWVNRPAGIFGTLTGSARALVRGHAKGADAEADLYLVSARLSPEGTLLEVGDIHNLTQTNDADEGAPVRIGSRIAYVVSIDGRPEAVHVLDLGGHGREDYGDLTFVQKLQTKIADRQKTGQWRGIRRTVFTLAQASAAADLAVGPGGMFEVRLDAGNGTASFLIDPINERIVSGDSYAHAAAPAALTKPPTFGPWMSDRLRAASWFGDEKNQMLKAIVFTGEEWLKTWKHRITGDTSEKDVAEDIAALAAPTTATFTDPEIGWPPKPLEPILKPPLAGEGKWILLDKDAFITPIPGVPSPFLTTFVRTDPAALYTRVYITLWDPRLVQLHMQAGTIEPVSATGAVGTGQIPRTPEVMKRVVAAFNGGFQATHGQYGMQVGGMLYLPPKPYAATVMDLDDGSTAFGAWPRSTEVPEEIISFRQNMTALVQNDKYNPWGRTWWGGVPPGWHDAIHTTRSGLCLTKENFVAYFWGNDIGPEPLGRAMLAARCAFGIHLDMNPGLAGFEFYNVRYASNFEPLGRSLQPDWEVEGTLKDMPNLKFRSRRMIKSMGHILFPRYIHRDARDFFYLTARPVLPGAPISAPTSGAGGGDGGGASGANGNDGDSGLFRTKGLPQHGYPYAVATTSMRLGPLPTDRRVRILRLDPRTVAAAPAVTPESTARTTRAPTEASQASPLVVTFGLASSANGANGTQHHAQSPPFHVPGHATADAHPADRKLCLGGHALTIDKACSAGAVAIADLLPPSSPASANARTAAGISDENGMLQWIELLPEDSANSATAEAMLNLLARIGCSSRGLVAGDVRAWLGGALDIGGEPAAAPPGGGGVRLVRTPSPGAHAYFDPTVVVPASVWAPLQAQRVKWRPTLAPPEKPDASASGATHGTAPPSESATPAMPATPRATRGEPHRE